MVPRSSTCHWYQNFVTEAGLNKGTAVDQNRLAIGRLVLCTWAPNLILQSGHYLYFSVQQRHNFGRSAVTTLVKQGLMRGYYKAWLPWSFGSTFYKAWEHTMISMACWHYPAFLLACTCAFWIQILTGILPHWTVHENEYSYQSKQLRTCGSTKCWHWLSLICANKWASPSLNKLIIH